jgi:uncharacterized protein DUF4058
MPIHDWTRVDAGLFHDFHQDWTIELRRSLNAGRLPPGYVALVDQQTGGLIPDVLTLNRGLVRRATSEPAVGLGVATAPPTARFVVESEGDVYSRRANRIRIQHRHGEVVAVIEIVSPGNKSSQTALRAFVRKTSELIWQGFTSWWWTCFRHPNAFHRESTRRFGTKSMLCRSSYRRINLSLRRPTELVQQGQRTSSRWLSETRFPSCLSF